MGSKPDILHQLVHSLDASEKRYFRIHAGRHARGPATLKLYDALLEMETYDEAVLRKLLDGETLLKQLPVARNYLKGLVLQSLRSFHRGKTVAYSLRERLDEIELLHGRGQIDALEKLLRRTWKKAWTYQRPLVLMELIQWRSRLTRRLRGNDLREQLSQLAAEQSLVAREIQEEANLRSLHDELFALVQELGPGGAGPFSSRIEAIFEMDGVREPVATFFDGEMIRQYLFIWGKLLLGDFAGVTAHYWNLVCLWKENPHQISDRQEVYLTLLCSYMDTCLSAREYSHYPEALELLRDLNPKNQLEEYKLFFWSNHLEIRYLIARESYAEAFRLVPGIARGLERFSSFWGASGDLTFLHNVAAVCFMNRRYKEALPWVNRVLNHPKVDVRKDLQRAARMFLLIIHWERKNHDLLEQLIRSQRRVLRRQSADRDLEWHFLGSMEGLLRELPNGGRDRFCEEMEQLLSGETTQPGSEAIRFWFRNQFERTSG